MADPETDVESIGARTDVGSGSESEGGASIVGEGARTDVESGSESVGDGSIVGEGARTDVEDPDSGTDVGF